MLKYYVNCIMLTMKTGEPEDARSRLSRGKMWCRPVQGRTTSLKFPAAPRFPLPPLPEAPEKGVYRYFFIKIVIFVNGPSLPCRVLFPGYGTLFPFSLFSAGAEYPGKDASRRCAQQ